MRKLVVLLGLISFFFISCETVDLTENEKQFEKFNTGRDQLGDQSEQEDEEY